MKTIQLFSLLLLALATLSFAWTKEDHEIFRLRDDIISHEGPDTTFYSFVGVQPGASSDAIEKAYRKRSRQLHPDKAVQAAIAARSLPKKSTGKKPGVTVTKAASAKEKTQITKEVTERYARLSVVGSILRGPSRQRYDHFLRNGFPRWRGSGYYYERFRPGLISVLLGLLVTFGGAIHYGAMYISAKRQREFVQRYISHARRTAWGNESGVPGINEGVGGSSYAPPPEEMNNEAMAMPMNRRQKRMQDKDNRKNSDVAKSTRAVRVAKKQGISPPIDAEPIAGPQGVKKKVIAENGKVLIVDSTGQVFLQESTQEGQSHEYLLDVCVCSPLCRISTDKSAARRNCFPHNLSNRSFPSSHLGLPEECRAILLSDRC